MIAGPAVIVIAGRLNPFILNSMDTDDADAPRQRYTVRKNTALSSCENIRRSGTQK